MKVCFVGIGSIAKRHINNLSEICKEYDINLRIDALRRSQSIDCYESNIITNVYSKIKHLPDDYDIIFLTNPTEYHADMLLALHNHGKHFFIEKPIASLNTINKLDGFKFRNDSIYYVACPLRYNRVIQYIKENVNLDTVNSVRSISSSYLPDWRPEVDYRDTYSAHKELGGGVSIDLIHEWDYLSYIFGIPSDMHMYKGKVSKLEINSDDYAIYIAKYSSMIVELHLDYFGRKTIRQVEIYTDKETIIGDLLEGRITYMTAGKHIDLSEGRDDYQRRELRYFMSLMNKGNDTTCDVKHAIKVLKLSQGILD